MAYGYLISKHTAGQLAQWYRDRAFPLTTLAHELLANQGIPPPPPVPHVVTFCVLILYCFCSLTLSLLLYFLARSLTLCPSLTLFTLALFAPLSLYSHSFAIALSVNPYQRKWRPRPWSPSAAAPAQWAQAQVRGRGQVMPLTGQGGRRPRPSPCLWCYAYHPPVTTPPPFLPSLIPPSLLQSTHPPYHIRFIPTLSHYPPYCIYHLVIVTPPTLSYLFPLDLFRCYIYLFPRFTRECQGVFLLHTDPSTGRTIPRCPCSPACIAR